MFDMTRLRITLGRIMFDMTRLRITLGLGARTSCSTLRRAFRCA